MERSGPAGGRSSRSSTQLMRVDQAETKPRGSRRIAGRTLRLSSFDDALTMLVGGRWPANARGCDRSRARADTRERWGEPVARTPPERGPVGGSRGQSPSPAPVYYHGYAGLDTLRCSEPALRTASKRALETDGNPSRCSAT